MKLTLDDVRRIAEHTIPPSTKHMTPQERLDGVGVMLDDLGRLAKEDGLVAAGWALERIIEVSKGDDK